MTDPTPDQLAAREELKVLNESQMQAVIYVSKGFSTDEIAEFMCKSAKTVEAYRSGAQKSLHMNMNALCCLIGRSGLA